MRLTDLEPHWIIQGGHRVGFLFRCPTKPDCWQSCFVESPTRREQWALFAETIGPHDVQGCTQGTRWAIAGGIETANFDTLTVTPSIDGSRGGNWHGFITNGEIVGAV